eukprot:7130488-Alexandrium_andersonii.AAC.1
MSDEVLSAPFEVIEHPHNPSALQTAATPGAVYFNAWYLREALCAMSALRALRVCHVRHAMLQASNNSLGSYLLHV